MKFLFAKLPALPWPAANCRVAPAPPAPAAPLNFFFSPPNRPPAPYSRRPASSPANFRGAGMNSESMA